ncbi:hypothetical protein AVEN_91055-1 [Araneus ventricosus]|uniref:Histone-lysine N-methyltransferase SETMAR n=1 Tax=Araneus ventricosus TaxID=182803 RepID=A0A4Y2KSF4_ARAVE|nr:hypothetical protein AVEN_91055-1 [Araneus ventricosus]
MFPGTSNTVSPFDISPVPNIKKRSTTRGGKATRSNLITGSPYKDQLTKFFEKSAPKNTSLSVPWRYEAGRVFIKDLPLPVSAYGVIDSATISSMDELIRQNRRITTREIAVELSISKGIVHHIIRKKLGYGKVCAQWVPKHLLENQNTVRRELDPSAIQEFLH